MYNDKSSMQTTFMYKLYKERGDMISINMLYQCNPNHQEAMDVNMHINIPGCNPIVLYWSKICSNILAPIPGFYVNLSTESNKDAQIIKNGKYDLKKTGFSPYSPLVANPLYDRNNGDEIYMDFLPNSLDTSSSLFVFNFWIDLENLSNPYGKNEELYNKNPMQDKFGIGNTDISFEHPQSQRRLEPPRFTYDNTL